jgi:hypothetical protein
MGLYIRPATLVEESGRRVSLESTWNATRTQLRPGEELSVVAQRAHGKVALLMKREGDFRVVSMSQQGILGLCAISAELARQAC